MSSASKLIHIQLNFCIDIIFQCLLRPLAFEVFFIVVGRFTILIWKMADFASRLANLGKKYGKRKKTSLALLIYLKQTLVMNFFELFWDAALRWWLLKLLLSFHPNAKVLPGKLKRNFASKRTAFLMYCQNSKI